MYDDVAHIRATVKELVEAEKDVVLVLHSVAGLLGSDAIEGLSSKARKAAGLKGGVVRIVFIAAATAPEGFEHVPLPFFDFQVRDLTIFFIKCLRLCRAELCT